MSILDTAKELVHQDRRKDYDHPSVFFAKYASILSAFLAAKLTDPITPEEANMTMILFKLIREQGKPKLDNRIDIAGYAETLDMIHQAKNELSTTTVGPTGPIEYNENNIKNI